MDPLLVDIPDPVVLPRELRLGEELPADVATAEILQDVKREIKALPRGRDSNEAQVELCTIQLGPVVFRHVDEVRDDRDFLGRPIGSLKGQARVMRADADHPVDAVDRGEARPGSIKLETMEADDEPLVRSPVVAVPD